MKSPESPYYDGAAVFISDNDGNPRLVDMSLSVEPGCEISYEEPLEFDLSALPPLEETALPEPSPTSLWQVQISNSDLPKYLGRDRARKVRGKLTYDFEDTEPVVRTRKEKIKRATKKAGVVTLLGMAVYAGGVAQGLAEAHNAHSSLSHVYDAESAEDADTMVVDFSGLSGNDAYQDARSEVAYQKLGSVEALKYGNTLDPPILSKEIIEYAKSHGKHKIILSGRSMGGLVAINTALEILKNSDLEIPYIILDCPPSSIDSVRPEKLTFVDAFTWSIAHIPGIKHSTHANFIAQYLAEIGSVPKFIDNGLLKNAELGVKVSHEIESEKKASITLINSEYNAIIGANMPASLKEMGEQPLLRRPVIVVMQPENPADDDTILSEVAAGEYLEFAKDAKVAIVIVRVPGISHANPGYKFTFWNDGMTNQVIPAMEETHREIVVQYIQSRIIAILMATKPTTLSGSVIMRNEAAEPLTQANDNELAQPTR